jgi:hypothetical protein
MRTTIFIFNFLLLVSFTLNAQNQCEPNNGIYSYTFRINIPDVDPSYDKEDFITFISNNSNISPSDLDILSSSLIYVKKGFSSNSYNNGLKATSSSEIFDILAQNNSLFQLFCHSTDCLNDDGNYRYYLLLSETNVPGGFDKTDLLNYIINSETISNDDLTTLDQSINLVFQEFEFSTDPFYHRIISVVSATELYDIFDDLENTIQFMNAIYSVLMIAF